ncbi:hypothetical protein VE00_00184 [Pseudogymnoascus sp. WSF 3629]|nr:hypothetical protein VE00_00184 [Pseudogymnoascus sp. WSF 3629]
MYSEAEGHFLRALNIKKSVGDERSHPVEFAEAYKNLAIVRLAEGNSSVAISLMTQALKLVKSEYDENTAIIQQNRFHLAAILCNSGQYDEALEESLSILRIRVELFGEKGLPTLNSFYALGMMYYLLGKYGLAEEALTASLASLDISRWQPECITRAKYLLSQVLFGLNKTQEAAALEKEARVSLETFLSAYAPLLHAAWHSGTITDELMLYDHLVSIHCGRYTIGKLAICCEKP